jgi:hypothetical protein
MNREGPLNRALESASVELAPASGSPSPKQNERRNNERVDENKARNQKQKVLSLFPRLFEPLETAMRVSVIVSVAVFLISGESKVAMPPAGMMRHGLRFPAPP